MHIERRRPKELSSRRADAAVVMDVLRMTSTAAVLMASSSCALAAVAATLGDLDRLGKPRADLFLISELEGAAASGGAEGAWIDNSPARIARAAIGQRTPVLVTTNGTSTLLAAAACADRTFLASFVDLHAVARYIAAMAFSSVMLVPAGHYASGELRVEDDLCADALDAILRGDEPGLDAKAALVRADPRVRRRIAGEPGFADDLAIALRPDARATALELRPFDQGVGHIVRAR